MCSRAGQWNTKVDTLGANIFSQTKLLDADAAPKVDNRRQKPRKGHHAARRPWGRLPPRTCTRTSAPGRWGPLWALLTENPPSPAAQPPGTGHQGRRWLCELFATVITTQA